ncbi:hypothetical protein [Ekhidna sp.]|uniref:hypothetical protein n=1 Tax=Ekhidna sp. TaxID=2608089 RepID=UPI003B591398
MDAIKLEKGEVIVDENTITIIDQSKKQSRWLLVSSVAWTLYGIISVFRYIEEGDDFLLWTGLFIGIGHFIIAFYYLFINTTQSVIPKDQIKSIKKGSRLGLGYVSIKLKSGRTRKINQLGSKTDEIVELIRK